MSQYIGIHIRRNDFVGWCRDVPREECFAPLSAYARRVEEIRQELLQDKGIDVSRVLVMSDENETPTVSARGSCLGQLCFGLEGWLLAE